MSLRRSRTMVHFDGAAATSAINSDHNHVHDTDCEHDSEKDDDRGHGHNMTEPLGVRLGGKGHFVRTQTFSLAECRLTSRERR